MIKGDYLKTKIIIRDSVFRKNAAITGGVICTLFESKVEVYNTIFEENFAVNSGVIFAHNHGYFEMYDTKIINNKAISVSIGEMSDSSYDSKLSKVTIFGNEIIDLDLMKTELNRNGESCLDLCSLPYGFRVFLKEH